MIRDITLGQYYPVDSVLHRMDPRTKLFGTLVFIVSLFFANSFPAMWRPPVFGHSHRHVKGTVFFHGARLKGNFIFTSDQC